ncbi:MAG: DUF192 domain-containing protein [Candidatus Latescibacterota bacterium]|nr:MAG: DUF192 domain-containing protein [Candidatus Latescibacterota bacterium]
MKQVEVRNATRGTVLLSRGPLAESWRTRLIGLMGRKGLAEGEGMVIRPCEAIHTMWMHFPIDVVFVDVKDVVVAVFPRVRPFRFRLGGRDADTVIEGPVGMIAKSGTRAGDSLQIGGK